MDITSLPLAELRTRLESRILRGHLVLEADTVDDTRLTRFIGGLPGGRLEFASPSFTLTDTTTWPQHLTVTGPVGTAWPVSALGPGALDPGTVTLTVSRNAAGERPAVNLGIAGTLHADPVTVPVTGELTEDGALRCVLGAGGHPPQSLADLVALLSGAPPARGLPAAWPFTTGLTIDRLDLLERGGPAPQTTLTLELGAAVDWVVVPDRLVLRSVGLILTRTQRSDPYGITTAEFAARLHATLTVGRDVTVAVDIGSPEPWQLLVLPADGTLPSLADIAGFIGGTGLQEAVRAGTQAVGLGEIGIDVVRVGFDPYIPALRNAVITGHVMLAGVRIDVEVQLPRFRFTGYLGPSRARPRCLWPIWPPVSACPFRSCRPGST
jgi:hypothetical protein